MRLRQLKERYPGRVALAHRAFLLRPEDRTQQFTEYHLQHRRAAKRLTGLPFDLPAVGDAYPRSSFSALEAAKWVERHHPERFEEYDLSLFEAFFAETRDISSAAVLADLAQRLDLPGAALAEALRAGELREAVWADHREAMEVGVTSIPTVVMGGYGISGAVPYEEYAQAAERLLGGPTG